MLKRIEARYLFKGSGRTKVKTVTGLVLAALAVSAGSSTTNAQVVPGEYIVVLNNNVGNPAAAAQQLTTAHGVQLGFVYTHAIKGFSFAGPAAAAQALARSPRVAFVEADQLVEAFCHQGDPQVMPTGIDRSFASANGNVTIDGTDDLRIDVDVAVLDTGIFDHFDLNVVARTDCSGGSPFKGNCKNNQGDDGNGHGTHVSGTIAAIDGGGGVVGMAPGARLHAVKVLSDNGSGQIAWVVAGIDWITARADTIKVANMSLGCACSSAAMNTAITNSVAAGVTYVVAAGNSDANSSGFSPANHPDVITVSALADSDGSPGGGGGATCNADLDDTLANFSNWGSMVEITAPGDCILSLWKDNMCAAISGTSMASPHVAGAAALLVASGVSGPATIRQTLIDKGNFNWIDDSGDGFKEPLLDVSDTSVFAPATVPGADAGCAVNADCGDGDACNGAELCVAGSCQAGVPVVCDDSSACTNDSCNPADGSCSFVAINCNDGDACSDDSCDDITGCVNTFPACGLADLCCGPDCDAGSDPDCGAACGGNKDACSVNADCCSGNCKNGTCRGN